MKVRYTFGTAVGRKYSQFALATFTVIASLRHNTARSMNFIRSERFIRLGNQLEDRQVRVSIAEGKRHIYHNSIRYDSRSSECVAGNQAHQPIRSVPDLR